MGWNTYFIVLFEHQPKFGQKGGKKNTFQILQNTSYKKSVLLQLPFWPKIGVFQLVFFFETNNSDVEQKT